MTQEFGHLIAVLSPFAGPHTYKISGKKAATFVPEFGKMTCNY
jgi:hypothetical protein